MPRVRTRSSDDRRRIVSSWFKRRIASLGIMTGLVVLGAVLVGLGAAGIAIGVFALAGGTALVLFERRRRWNEAGRLPDRPDLFPH